MIESRDFRITGPKARTERDALDALSYDEVVTALGEPDKIVTEYYESPWWKAGDRRPDLATDDVAVVQAMGRCLTARTRDAILTLGGIHPTVCGWCDYPVAELRAAVGHAAYMARGISVERATWNGRYASHYDRATPREGTYENPAWATWFMDWPDRRMANERRRDEIAAAAAVG